MGPKDSGIEPGHLCKLQYSTQGVGDSAADQRSQRGKTNGPIEQGCGYQTRPAETEIEQQTDPFRHRREKEQFQQHAGHRCAPDDCQNTPAPETPEFDDVDRRVGCRDQEEDSGVVEFPQQIPGSGIMFQKMEDATCGQCEDNADHIDDDRGHPQSITVCPLHQTDTKYTKGGGGQQMGQ